MSLFAETTKDLQDLRRIVYSSRHTLGFNAAGLEIFDIKQEKAKQTNDYLEPEEKSRI